jgi:hypothetical protein
MSIQYQNEKVKFRLPTVFVILVIVLVIVAVWIVGFLTGVFSINDILLNFIGFISMLISITTLAIVGAIFFGMYISHRILSKRGFTPFEMSMMEMHEDIKEIKTKIAQLEKEMNGGNKTKPK